MAAKGFGAFLPRVGRGRSVRRRPVALRKLRGHVLRVAGKFQNVPKSDAHVLEQLPRTVRRTLRLRSLKFDWEIGKRFLPGNVGVAAVQKVAKLFADDLCAC